jgi:hypothetical protein
MAGGHPDLTGSTTESMLVPSELTVADPRRVLMVLLTEYGPLCERCLAYHARLTISHVAAMLETLREHVALRVEHCECPGCHQFTQAFSLAKTHDDAEGDPPARS